MTTPDPNVAEVIDMRDAAQPMTEAVVRFHSVSSPIGIDLRAPFGADVVCDIEVCSDPKLKDRCRRTYTIAIGSKGALDSFH